MQQYRIIEYQEIDSTNSEAKRIASSNTPVSSILWAHKQSAGRGRYGRVWDSSVGNLYMSILMPLECSVSCASELSFVMGLATYDVVNSLINQPNHLSLKWPNDIFIDDNKIGGILLESITHKNQTWIIIGLGLNLQSSPHDIKHTSSLKEYGINILPKDILALIIDSFKKHHAIWRANSFTHIRKSWLEKAYRLGQEITLGYDTHRVSGVFESIDQSGAIKLRLKSGEVKTMYTGEIFCID